MVDEKARAPHEVPFVLCPIMLGRMPINSSRNFFVIFYLSETFIVFNSIFSRSLHCVEKLRDLKSSRNFFCPQFFPLEVPQLFFRWPGATKVFFFF